jgi:hypothetical protein
MTTFLISLTRVTPAGGLFGWGGTPLKKYQRYLIVGSDPLEMGCRG